MIISGMVKSSLVDYPGLAACVLFVPGCNYNCFYCHNRSLLDGTHEVLFPGYVEKFIEKRTGLLDGVVISGGEPTLQKDLIPFMKMIKKLGYKLKLDTNGSSPAVIEKILEYELCDYFAVDYKAPAGRYEEICQGNSSAEAVLNTIHLLLKSNSGFEVRTTVIPQLGRSDLFTMAQELPVVPKYVLNRYRAPDSYNKCDSIRIMQKPYTQQEISTLVQAIREHQPNTIS
ncbi:MAG: anaerobic ribonucleoside-triphosphate reductase activating protein [Eubacterium sp.]|jgi:pyruvate formate lyase activating enzyme|nr:anaerobic ribonucleoside-triphosphate reductase activating protein [Eubacterium sp.]